MPSEARKIHVIEEVLKVQSEAVLIEIESLLKRKSGQQKQSKVGTKRKPSEYAGSLSKEKAELLLQHSLKSRDEWERDI